MINVVINSSLSLSPFLWFSIMLQTLHSQLHCSHSIHSIPDPDKSLRVRTQFWALNQSLTLRISLVSFIFLWLLVFCWYWYVTHYKFWGHFGVVITTVAVPSVYTGYVWYLVERLQSIWASGIDTAITGSA